MVFSRLTLGQTSVHVGLSFSCLRDLLPTGTLLFCCDPGVPKPFVAQLREQIPHCLFWMAPGGEQGKSREVKAALEDVAMAQGVGADGVVVVLGGGATLDLVGFFAATFGRGIPHISLPSTLLAMADTCLGGKNGVNVGGVKNAIGTIRHPRDVLINVSLLESLDDRQLVCGGMEIAKHAMLMSESAFNKFLGMWPTRDLGALEQMVVQSLQYKGSIVASGCPERRHVLNLGHTVGHALEGVEVGLDHGIGVAIGLFVEASVGFQKGYVSRRVVSAAEALLEFIAPYVSLNGSWGFSEFLAVMQKDKKNRSGQPHMVLLEDFGRPYEGPHGVCVEVDEADVALAYRLLDRFRGHHACALS